MENKLIIWNSNIYNEEEKENIISRSNELNYTLIDSRIIYMIKIIECCKQYIKQESLNYDNNKIEPYIITKKENILKNDLVESSMYGLLRDDLSSYSYYILTKDEVFDSRYISYDHYLNDELEKAEEVIDTFDEFNEVDIYNINHLIPLYIQSMLPKIKYNIEKETDNIYILKSKRHQVKVLLVDEINEDIEIAQYNLIIETDDLDVPSSSILSDIVLNDVYDKYSKQIKDLVR